MKERKSFRVRRQDDDRVTAPMVPWQLILIVLGIMILLATAQTFIVDAYLDKIGALVGVLTAYLIFVSMVLAGGIWLVWRQTTGKPLRMIAKAARKVAEGDFSIQLPFGRKNGRMNEIDVLIEDFNKMVRELAGNEMLKNDFISNVSHPEAWQAGEPADLPAEENISARRTAPVLRPAVYGTVAGEED